MKSYVVITVEGGLVQNEDTWVGDEVGVEARAVSEGDEIWPAWEVG